MALIRRSRQGGAITGRRVGLPALNLNKPPYYPQEEEPVSAAPAIQPLPAAPPPVVQQEAPALPQRQYNTFSPGFEGHGSTTGPNPSSAMAEGQMNTDAPVVSDMNAAAVAAQEGRGLAALGHGLKGLIGFTPMGMAANVLGRTVVDPVKKGITALAGLGQPANSGSAVASGTGISGLSGPMGLAAVEAGQGFGLADIDIGGFGEDSSGDDGMGGMGGLGDSGASVGGGMGDF